MYLELIFTGIKTERWKVAEVSKIAYLGHLGLKQEWKIVQGSTGVRKMVYAGFEAGRMRELKHKSYRGKIVYLGTEEGKKYCLCSDWSQLERLSMQRFKDRPRIAWEEKQMQYSRP